MQVETMMVGDLLRDPANVRKHDTKNLESIKGSLKAFGQQKPIVVDKNGIVIAGNGTLAAAVQLGWERIVVVRSDLEGTNRTAYAIADNRTSDLADWDNFALDMQLSALADMEFDLASIGFDDINDDKGDLDLITDDNVGESASLKVKCKTEDEIEHLREIFKITKKSNEISYHELIARIEK